MNEQEKKAALIILEKLQADLQWSARNAEKSQNRPGPSDMDFTYLAGEKNAFLEALQFVNNHISKLNKEN